MGAAGWYPRGMSILLVLATQIAIILGFPHAPRAILDAAAERVAADPSPLEGSADLELAVLLEWVYRESSFRADAVGDGGAAHGPVQLHGSCGLRSLPAQIDCWLAIVHEGERRCPKSPLAMTWGACTPKYRGLADWRVADARRVLAAIRDALPKE